MAPGVRAEMGDKTITVGSQLTPLLEEALVDRYSSVHIPTATSLVPFSAGMSPWAILPLWTRGQSTGVLCALKCGTVLIV